MRDSVFTRLLITLFRLKTVRGLAAILVVVVMWETLSQLGLYNTQLFPGPSRIAVAFAEMLLSGEWRTDLQASGFRYVLGLVAGSFVGVFLGALTGRVPLLRDTLGLILNYLRSTPSVALIPIAIIFFGISDGAKVFVVAWGVTFPVWVNTHSGVAGVEREYVWAARSLGARSWQLYWEVYVPRALPFVIAGTRIGIATGFFALAAAEMAGAFSGVAFRIFHSHQMFQTDKMMVGILTIGMLGLVCDQIFVFLVGWLLPWWKATARSERMA